jgi:hypothetical protein
MKVVDVAIDTRTGASIRGSSMAAGVKTGAVVGDFSRCKMGWSKRSASSPQSKGTTSVIAYTGIAVAVEGHIVKNHGNIVHTPHTSTTI